MFCLFLTSTPRLRALLRMRGRAIVVLLISWHILARIIWHTMIPGVARRSRGASVTLHLIPGITLVCFQSFSGIQLHYHCTKIPESCTQNPDEIPAEVCPGYKYKDDTILFPCVGFCPGSKYKPVDEFRDLGATNQPSRKYSGI